MHDCRHLPYGGFEMKPITSAAVRALLSVPALDDFDHRRPSPRGPCKFRILVATKLVAAAAAIAIFPSLAHAQEIDLGPSGNLSAFYEISSLGTGGLHVNAPNTMSGQAFFSGNPAGQWMLGPTSWDTSPVVIVPGMPNSFNAVPPATETLDIDNTISGTINFATIIDDPAGLNPLLTGTFDYTTDPLGDQDIIGAFGAGGMVPITLELLNEEFPTTLTDIAGMPESSLGTSDDVISGIILGAPPPPPPLIQTPEPMSSFMALGIALCCLWGTYQLTRRQLDRSRS
jgi:hypothetical protein